MAEDEVLIRRVGRAGTQVLKLRRYAFGERDRAPRALGLRVAELSTHVWGDHAHILRAKGLNEGGSS